MISVLRVVILLKGRCWHLLGTKLHELDDVSMFSQLLCRCSLVLALPGSHTEGAGTRLVPYFLYCLVQGSVLQRDFVLCCF